jgi:hypothetical protein
MEIVSQVVGSIMVIIIPLCSIIMLHAACRVKTFGLAVYLIVAAIFNLFGLPAFFAFAMGTSVMPVLYFVMAAVWIMCGFWLMGPFARVVHEVES